jgi:XTP/dITP diphosphohydrolase
VADAAATRAPIVLATRSAGKIRELSALLAELHFPSETLEALGLREEPAEEGIEVFDSFLENARAKARWFAALLPGRTVLAEDSGLVVDVLDGAPGVRSKRWSGSAAQGSALDDANNAALLDALRAVNSPSARSARYVCVAVLVEGGEEWSAEGRSEGRITLAARGTGGFGYDPYFESAELGKTFGEAAPEEKARVSHRARAVRAVCGAMLAAREGAH